MRKTQEIHKLDSGDIFFLEGKKYSIIENNGISTSFNEISALCEEENVNLRIRKNTPVYLEEKSEPKLNKPKRTPGESKKFAVKVRNEKGNIVTVRFGDPNMEIKRDDPGRRKSFRARHNCDSPGPKTKAKYWSCRMWEKGKTVSSLTEQKLSKDQIKKRDTCANELLDNPKFKERYSNSDNVKSPGKNIDDVAFGICTNRATGKGNKKGGRKKEKTNESFDRLNTIKNILRRDFK